MSIMWRGDDTGWFSTRLADVRSIYEEPEKTIELMKKYNATLLYVGDSERERYQVNISANGLEKIYSDKWNGNIPAYGIMNIRLQ